MNKKNIAKQIGGKLDCWNDVVNPEVNVIWRERGHASHGWIRGMINATLQQRMVVAKKYAKIFNAPISFSTQMLRAWAMPDGSLKKYA